MSNAFDDWTSGLGVDLEAARKKAGDWVDEKENEVKQDLKKAGDWIDEKKKAAEDEIDKGRKWVADKVDEGKKAVEEKVDNVKKTVLGDESGKPVPRPIERDCKPQKGKVPGPANHIYCGTHGHVLDTASKTIIASSVADYVKRGLAKVAKAVEDEGRKIVRTVEDDAKKTLGNAKKAALGDGGGGKLPRPMESDCKPQKGKVPGPKNHAFCSAHGHVLDVDARAIIAASVADYVKRNLAKALEGVDVRAQLSGAVSDEEDVDENSPDFKKGYETGLAGKDAAPGPRIGAALTDYEEGWSRGHEEFTHGSSQQPVGPAPERPLDERYREAMRNEDWSQAAELLNGFSESDIRERLSELPPDMVAELHHAALQNPRVGPNSNVAKLTKDPNERDPTADDPNTVYAGENFKIKMMESVSFGEVVGASTITFVVWDTDNDRAAVYEYVAVITTAGTPVTFSGEGDWASFDVSPPRQVDQLSCHASHASAGGGPIGGMILNLDYATITLMTGNSEGFGIESGPGMFNYVANSVKVFKGG